VRYALKRGLRILPGLFVVVALSACVLGPLITTLPLHDYFSDTRFWAYFKNLLFYPSYFLPGVFATNPYPHTVNGSLWTLPFEFFLYFGIILFLISSKDTITRILLVAATLIVGSLGIYMVYTPVPLIAVYGSDIRFFFLFGSYFVCGSMYAVLGGEKIFNPGIAVLLFLASFAMTGLVLKVFSLFALPYCVLTFGTRSYPFFNSAGRFGDFSYGLYIYAFPMQQWANFIFNGQGPWDQVLVFSLSLVLTFVCAFFSWHVVEKPMLGLKPRTINLAGEKQGMQSYAWQATTRLFRKS
jgi:peptidoglycan/LPS O-acetylase OafA/YrhL